MSDPGGKWEPWEAHLWFSGPGDKMMVRWRACEVQAQGQVVSSGWEHLQALESSRGVLFCFVFFFFGYPMAYARDQIPATVATYAAAVATWML